MAYGIQCWNENNNLSLNMNSRYTRLVYSVVTDSDGSVDLPEIQGHETVEWAEAINRGFWAQPPPTASRSGTTISWDISGLGTDALILVFLYT